MSCLFNSRDRYLARIEQYELLLADAYELQASLMQSKMRKYSLDTKEAEQRSELQRISEVSKAISFYESEIDRLCRKLSGCGLPSMTLRRKRYNGLGRGSCC